MLRVVMGILRTVYGLRYRGFFFYRWRYMIRAFLRLDRYSNHGTKSGYRAWRRHKGPSELRGIDFYPRRLRYGHFRRHKGFSRIHQHSSMPFRSAMYKSPRGRQRL